MTPNQNMKAPFRILIADDDPSMLRFLLRALEPHHYVCDTAADAMQATALLTAQDYDLLISDLDMPGNKDLRLIRDLPQIAAGLPVILLTGFPTVETAMQSLQLPVAAYLTKPCQIEELLHQVELAVQGHQAFRAVQASQERTEKWNRDLAVIGATLKKVRSPAAAPWETLLDLTVQNITASLEDVQTFAGVVRLRKMQPDPLRSAATQGPLQLLGAVRETISVLEHTRGSFKSKELGDLRKKLELLLS